MHGSRYTFAIVKILEFDVTSSERGLVPHARATHRIEKFPLKLGSCDVEIVPSPIFLQFLAFSGECFARVAQAVCTSALVSYVNFSDL
jgi:hypothetical protein